MRKREAKMKVEREIGISVSVRIVNDKGAVSTGELKLLSSSVIEQMKFIKKRFTERCPGLSMTKIEYIMNPSLYKEFDSAKKELRDRSRPSNEVVLFHGTRRQNINR